MTIRIALGTVQFGQRYGIANAAGQVGLADIAAILRHARAAGVDTLDTAIAYGDSEAQLGRAGVSGWRVITKLPSLPADVQRIQPWAEEQIAQSMQRMGVSQLEAVLLHRSADLSGPLGAEYMRTLEAMKASGVARAVGVSIYDPAELEAFWEAWRPDIVQAPCNVLDRRLMHSGWLDKLHRYGVRVHARSVFLQGLLLLPATRRPPGFAPWAATLDRWLSWCAEHGRTPLEASLAFVLAQSAIERAVVGVDSPEHLEEILPAAAARVPSPPQDLFSDDRELIEPSRWRRVA